MTSLADAYNNHVARLTESTVPILEAQGFDGAVIHSGRVVPKSQFDDLVWPFCPVPTFLHWADLAWPDCAIVVGPAPVRLAVVRPNSYWEAPPEPDWPHLRETLDVIELNDPDEVGRLLEPGRWAFIGHDPQVAASLGLEDDAVNPEGLIRELHETRVHKTDYEIECIARANQTGARGHRIVAETFASGVRSELALHLSYLAATGQDDPETPYKNIVALGAHGAVLHHVSYRDVPRARSLLIDAGAVYRGYNADITRTMVADGSGPDIDRFRALLEDMEDLQQRVCAAIRVGDNYEALHDLAHEALGNVLADGGLVHCSAEAATESGITRIFFPHGLGHGLGIQVHDVGHKNQAPRPENQFLRNTRDIEPRQVFTIEPGLYFIDQLLESVRAEPEGRDVNWEVVDRLRPFGGIRIEDNVLVLDEGASAPIRNFTREAFAAQ